MSPLLRADLSAPHLAPLSLRGLAARGAQAVAVWRRRARTRRDLSNLPAHLLRDIGLEVAAADAESRKPFWRG